MFDAQQPTGKHEALWRGGNTARPRPQLVTPPFPEVRHHVGRRDALSYAAFERWIIDPHAKNVRDRGYCIRADKNVPTQRDVVVFQWELLGVTEDRVAPRGFEVPRVHAERRVLVDDRLFV